MSPVLHAFFAQTAEGQAAQNPITAFLPFILIALVFYFVFFRPQQK
jgi:preprotein translocase subunit YajC